MLSRYQNLPNKQIAEQLHVSLKTVEAHITKALRILRLELKDYLASIKVFFQKKVSFFDRVVHTSPVIYTERR